MTRQAHTSHTSTDHCKTITYFDIFKLCHFVSKFKFLSFQFVSKLRFLPFIFMISNLRNSTVIAFHQILRVKFNNFNYAATVHCTCKHQPANTV